MSEPTYRIELTHEPQYKLQPWGARIFRISDDEQIARGDGETREKAFDAAQTIVRLMATHEPPSTVYLTEDGDIHDPHDQACAWCNGMGKRFTGKSATAETCSFCDGSGKRTVPAEVPRDAS